MKEERRQELIIAFWKENNDSLSPRKPCTIQVPGVAQFPCSCPRLKEDAEEFRELECDQKGPCKLINKLFERE